MPLADAVERLDCPTCAAPAGSPCRTRNGTTAVKYHIPRFLLVPELRDEHEVDVPADREPGAPWHERPRPRPAAIGYAMAEDRTTLIEQVTALRAAGCAVVLADLVEVAVRARPEFERALDLASAGLVVTELARLARNTAELVAVGTRLRGIAVTVLDGALAGRHEPESPLFTVLAAESELDRDFRRAKTRTAQLAAAARGKPGGRPKVFDEDMLAAARELRDHGVPVPEIARRLTITTGRNAGRHPSVASVYRALAEAESSEEVVTR